MSTRSSWKRFEGAHRSRQIQKSLQARIADPLWTLARQWQFGEFKGDDASTPVKARLRYNSVEVGKFCSYTPEGTIAYSRKLEPQSLLEPSIERDRIVQGSSISLRVNAEASFQFLRRFSVSKRKKLLGALQQEYRLVAPTKGQDGRAAFLKLMHMKGFDAYSFQKSTAPKRAVIAQEAGVNASTMENTFKEWLAYYRDRFDEPKAAEPFWQKDRLEYKFGVSAKAQNVNIHLKAEEYAGGHMDWYNFDLDEKNSSNLNKELKKPQTGWTIPTPVRYAGMPSDRYWDFEEGKVFFGGLSANKTDLSQLMLSEFATVYSNDWYLIPLTVKPGTLTRVHEVEVHDCFGDTYTITPTAVQDYKNGKQGWKFFELSNDPSSKHEQAPWLYIPKTVLGGYEDRPVEKVIFSRDEMANMAWGIEDTIEGQSGHRISRRSEWLKLKDEIDAYTGEYEDKTEEQDNEQAETEEAEKPWVYRLLTSVPPNWVPFISEVVKDKVTNRLIRGRMGEWDLLGDYKNRLAGGKGQILQPGGPMALQEEEIPRGAIEVTRSYQAARDADGKLVVWAGRKKRPSAGDKSSGRKTDVIEIEERKAS